MREQVQTVSGHAVIEAVFPLHNRGRALVLAEQFEGSIPRNGRIETSRGVMPYTGPDFVDGFERKAQFAVIVPEGHGAECLVAGEKVTFLESS